MCSLPGPFDKKMKMALHMYMGLDALEHKVWIVQCHL